MRVEFFGDEVEAIAEIDPLRGRVAAPARAVAIYPGEPLRHHRADRSEARRRRHPRRAQASDSRAAATAENKLLEAQRLEQRTLYDLEMLARDGLLPGHRELLAAPRPAASRASRRRR